MGRNFGDLLIDAYGDPGEDYPVSMAYRHGRMARITVAARHWRRSNVSACGWVLTKARHTATGAATAVSLTG